MFSYLDTVGECVTDNQTEGRTDGRTSHMRVLKCRVKEWILYRWSGILAGSIFNSVV